MSGNLKLKFTPESKADLFEIFEYVTKKLSAPAAAERLIRPVPEL